MQHLEVDCYYACNFLDFALIDTKYLDQLGMNRSLVFDQLISDYQHLFQNMFPLFRAFFRVSTASLLSIQGFFTFAVNIITF